MSLPCSLEQYRKYRDSGKESKRGTLDIYILIFAACISLFLMSILLYNMSLYAIFCPLAILCMIKLLDRTNKGVMYRRTIEESSPYLGELYDLFDKECPYVHEILKNNIQRIKNNILRNKGLSGLMILSLEDDIDDLKSTVLDDSKVRFCQDLYFLLKGEQKSQPLVSDIKEKIKICHQVDSIYEYYPIPVKKLFYLLEGVFLSMCLGSILPAFLETKDFIYVTYACQLISAVFVLTMIVKFEKYLPFIKISNRTLYEIIDASNPEAKNVLNENSKALIKSFKENNGLRVCHVFSLKKKFKCELEKRKIDSENAQKYKEESEIFIASGSKIGDMLSTLDNLK